MKREEIVKAIAEITKTMKRPLPNIERALLHEDRKELRQMLAELDAKEPCNA